MAGLYYKKWDQDNALVLVDAVAPGVDFGNFIFFNTENKSLFGEATRFFNDKWSGTLGARVFDEDKHDPFMPDGRRHRVVDEIRSGFVRVRRAAQARPRLRRFGAREALPQLRRGLSAGRRQSDLQSTNPDAPPTFDEDSNESFELGLKSATSSGKLVFNAAVFHVDWEDMQISGTPHNSALGFTTNAGDTHTEGLEAELTTRPLQGLDITLGGSLMEAELDDAAEVGDAGQPPASHRRGGGSR